MSDGRFDLYLHEPEVHYQKRQYLGALRGYEIPSVGDLLEMNATNLHCKYEVVQIHRFYSPDYESRDPRVYVKRLEG